MYPRIRDQSLGEFKLNIGVVFVPFRVTEVVLGLLDDIAIVIHQSWGGAPPTWKLAPRPDAAKAVGILSIFRNRNPVVSLQKTLITKIFDEVVVRRRKVARAQLADR